MAGVTNKQLLEAIQGLRDHELAGIKADLERFNGRIRFTEQSVVSLATWRKDHEKAGELLVTSTSEMRDEIVSLRNRQNIAATILAIAQAVQAGIGALFLGGDGKP